MSRTLTTFEVGEIKDALVRAGRMRMDFRETGAWPVIIAGSAKTWGRFLLELSDRTLAREISLMVTEHELGTYELRGFIFEDSADTVYKRLAATVVQHAGTDFTKLDRLIRSNGVLPLAWSDGGKKVLVSKADLRTAVAALNDAGYTAAIDRLRKAAQ